MAIHSYTKGIVYKRHKYPFKLTPKLKWRWYFNEGNTSLGLKVLSYSWIVIHINHCYMLFFMLSFSSLFPFYDHENHEGWIRGWTWKWPWIKWCNDGQTWMKLNEISNLIQMPQSKWETAQINGSRLHLHQVLHSHGVSLCLGGCDP